MEEEEKDLESDELEDKPDVGESDDSDEEKT